MNNLDRKQFHDAYITYNKVKIKDTLVHSFPIRLIKFINGSYQGDNNAYLNTIDEEKLWLSSPKELNDPFDCLINTDYKQIIRNSFFDFCNPVLGEQNAKALFRQGKELINITTEKVRGELIDHAYSIRKNVYMTCFSEFSNIKSLLMWSHYANNHKGFCAEYDFRQMNAKFNAGIIPVLYDNNYFLNENCNTDSECREYRLRIAFTKAREWKNEKEWRILEDNEEQEGEKGYYINFVRPIKIYMGCNIDMKLENDLNALCKKKGVELYKMMIKPNSFKLDYIKML